MPYTNDSPPERIQHLPVHAQRIFIAAYNSAEERGLPEENRNKIAWAAVKQKYRETAEGRWVAKGESMGADEQTPVTVVNNFSAPSEPVLETPVSGAAPTVRWFANIEKIDAEQRIVSGYATAAVVDRQDDLIPYETSKAAFAEFVEATGGAVREMHQPRAIGKVVGWRGDDAKKAIWVDVYLSKSADGENAMTKVREGILRAFSIGGKAERWLTKALNGRTVRELVKIVIRELSLVDVPANPQALVMLWKAEDAEPLGTEPPPPPEGMPEQLRRSIGSSLLKIFAEALDSFSKGALPTRDYGNTRREVSEVGVVQAAEPQSLRSVDGSTEQSGLAKAPTGEQLLESHPPAQDITAAMAEAAPTQAPVAAAVGVGTPITTPVAEPAGTVNNPKVKKDALHPCPKCAAEMKAAAEGNGFKCEKCGTVVPPEEPVAKAAVEQPLAKAVDDAPNYRVAPDAKRSCQTCAYFRLRGNARECVMYHFAAEADHTCDSWAADADVHKKMGHELVFDSLPEEQKALVNTEIAAFAKKSGIPYKEKEPKTPPKGYPRDRAQYADPANYSWPVDTRRRAIAAVAYYNAGKGKDKYSKQEWYTLGRRIARMAGAKTGFKYKFNPAQQQIERVDKGGSMDKAMVDQMTNLVDAAQKAAERGESPDDYLTQLRAALDVARDAPETLKVDGSPSDQSATRGGTHPGAKPSSVPGSDKPSAPKEKAVAPEPNDPRIGGAAPMADAAAAVNTPVMGAGGGMVTAPATRSPESPAGDSSSIASATVAAAVSATPVKPSPDSPSPTPSPSPKDSTPGKETPASKESDTKPGAPMGKADEIFATTPPVAPDLFIPKVDDLVQQKLPSFMAALEGGSLKKAQEIADHDQMLFDEMFHKSTRRLLDAGGWRLDNISKIGAYFGGLQPGRDDSDLKKAIVSTDIPGLYLQRLAKLMLPVYAGLRRRLPAQTPPVGATLSQWRAELGFTNFSFAQALYNVPEASGTIGSTTGTGQQVQESFLLFQAPFKRIALNDAVTLEAIAATRGYDDPLQVAVVRAMTALIISEERKILGDNNAALSAMGTVTTALAAGGALVSGTTYTVKVSALTYIGYLLSTVSGFAGAAAAGETAVAAGSGQAATTANGTVTATWASIPGAVAYNVYVFNGTNERYYSTVTIPKVSVTSMPGAGNAGPTADNSANANGYEGILSWCTRSTVYSQTIPNKTVTDQAGAGLTTYAGGIVEFDTILQNLWTNWQIAPSLIITSPRGAKHLTKQVLSANNPAIYRFEVSQERGTISGGAFVSGYVNKFAPYADGTPRVIDVMAHPYAVNDNYLFVTESINYPLAREARGYALDIIIPYTYFPLAQTTIHYPFAMLCSETLDCFHPSAQAALIGVDTTQ